jgi:hypothetical protein
MTSVLGEPTFGKTAIMDEAAVSVAVRSGSPGESRIGFNEVVGCVMGDGLR